MRHSARAMQVLQEAAQDLNHVRLGTSASRTDHWLEELVNEGKCHLPEISIGKMCREVREELTTPSPMEVQGGFSKTAMMLQEREILVEHLVRNPFVGRHDASFLLTRSRARG
jgi:hypothetical protein